MNPCEAIEFAQELMLEYGLLGWRAKLDNAVRRYCACDFSPQINHAVESSRRDERRDVGFGYHPP